MKKVLISILKNKETALAHYRDAAEKLGWLLAAEAAELIPKKQFSFRTPLAETQGTRLHSSVVLVPILRSGVALLPAFLRFFTNAAVGFIGMKRDEHTALPFNNYQNLPTILPTSQIILLEPMIATGGSISVAIEILLDKGAREENIIVAGVLAAPEGLDFLKRVFPKVKIVAGAVDQCLNGSKFIVPGLGDFGDRYFGTTE